MPKSEVVTPATIHLTFEAAGVVGLREVPGQTLQPGQAFVESDEMLISNGTEVHDLYNGETYPKLTVGYALAGRLTQINSRSTRWQEGDRVAINYGHATGHVVTLAERNRMTKIPDWMNNRQAALVPQIMPISEAGVIHLADKLNRSRDVRDIHGCLKDREVAVIGGGLVGLLTGAVAKHVAEAGRVVLIDDVPDRLKGAEKLGMETINHSELKDRDPAAAVKRLFSREKTYYGFNAGNGADGTFNTANSGYALDAAYRMLHDGGVNVDMAYHEGEVRGLYKGGKFHTEGLTDQSGYVNKLPFWQRALWPKSRLASEGVEILHDIGDTVEEVLITHEGTFVEAQTIYERIKNREPGRIITALTPGDLSSAPILRGGVLLAG